MMNGQRPKPLFWVGSSKKDLKGFPLEVRRVMGFALFHAQTGGKHVDAWAQPEIIAKIFDFFDAHKTKTR